MGIADHNAPMESDAKLKGVVFHRGFVQRVQPMLLDVVRTPGPTTTEVLYTEFAPEFERAIFRSIIQIILKSQYGSIPAISQTYYATLDGNRFDKFGTQPHFYDTNVIDVVYWPPDESAFYEFLSINMADTKWPMDPKNARYCYYIYVQSVRYTFIEPCSFTLINPEFGTYTVKRYSHCHNKVEHFIGFKLFQMWTEELQKQIKND